MLPMRKSISGDRSRATAIIGCTAARSPVSSGPPERVRTDRGMREPVSEPAQVHGVQDGNSQRAVLAGGGECVKRQRAMFYRPRRVAPQGNRSRTEFSRWSDNQALARFVRDPEWCPDAITNSLCVNRMRV